MFSLLAANAGSGIGILAMIAPWHVGAPRVAQSLATALMPGTSLEALGLGSDVGDDMGPRRAGRMR